MFDLRDYQREAIESLYKYFQNKKGNPLLVLPTAAGKSVIIGKFCEEVVRQWPDQKILILTHVKELIEQNHAKLRALNPYISAGIYSASLKSRDLKSSVIFAGIQSIHKKAFDLGRVDLVIIDECHLVNNKAQGTYRKFLNDLKTANPRVKVIGTTATPYRLNNGLLTDGDERIFTDIAFDLPIKRLLDKGFLSPVRTTEPEQVIDLSNVKTRSGDFAKGDLDQAVHRDGFTDSAIKQILRHGQKRRSWLIFCPSVDYAHEICDLLSLMGVRSACVTGSTPKNEREEILKDYKAGKIKAVCNCDVLTTGFDAPATDLLVLLRATKSTALYVQIIGRGMRISPETGKLDCLVLDFGGNVERHGPIDSIEVASKIKKGNRKGVAPTKKCPQCAEILSAFVRQCTNCLFEFPERPKHESMATSAAILSEDIKPEWFDVTAVTYQRHVKPGKPDSLKVQYRCGLKFFNEWILLEHVGFPQAKAVQWWGKHSQALAPASVSKALDIINSEGIRKPARIKVKKTGKYFEILGHDFDRGNESADCIGSRESANSA